MAEMMQSQTVNDPIIVDIRNNIYTKLLDSVTYYGKMIMDYLIEKGDKQPIVFFNGNTVHHPYSLTTQENVRFSCSHDKLDVSDDAERRSYLVQCASLSDVIPNPQDDVVVKNKQETADDIRAAFDLVGLKLHLLENEANGYTGLIRVKDGADKNDAVYTNRADAMQHLNLLVSIPKPDSLTESALEPFHQRKSSRKWARSLSEMKSRAEKREDSRTFSGVPVTMCVSLLAKV